MDDGCVVRMPEQYRVDRRGRTSTAGLKERRYPGPRKISLVRTESQNQADHMNKVLAGVRTIKVRNPQHFNSNSPTLTYLLFWKTSRPIKVQTIKWSWKNQSVGVDWLHEATAVQEYQPLPLPHNSEKTRTLPSFGGPAVL